MTLREVLQRSASWLDERGFESARLEAELLVAHVLETNRVTLYTDGDRPLIEDELRACRGALRRRAAGEPVAYITGRREFYGLDFEVSPAVLVPRPETELLVDRARELAPATIADIGTGCGCIAVACAHKLADATVTATDISPDALAVAARNVARHGVAERVTIARGDLFEALPHGARFDLVVSNPPYVAEGAAADVARHEPKGALYAGPTGLDVIRRLVAEAPHRLAPGGTLLVEIGEDQGDAVLSLASARFGRAMVHRDLAGLPRVLEASAQE